VWHCLDAVAAAGLSDEKNLLLEVLSSNLEWWIRGMALKRLAVLEGDEGISRLCSELGNPRLKKDAAEGLAKLARGTKDAAVIEALSKAVDAKSDVGTTSTVVRAIVAISGGSHRVLSDLIERVDPNVAMTIHWLMNGLGPTSLAERLALLISDKPPLALELVAQYESEWNEKQEAVSILWNILHKVERITGFDVKAADLPNAYTNKMREMANITDAVLVPEALSSSTEQIGEARLRISFVHKGQGFSFTVKDLGRYFDLESMFQGVNGVLASLGREERFFQLYTGDQTTIIVFAKELPFLELARDFRIPIEFNAEAARQRGMEYTHYVLSTLRG
jgi:hypothetical protein